MQPFDRRVSIRTAVDADDVKSCEMSGVGSPGCEEHLGCANEFALFVIIDRQRGSSEAAPGAITHLDEDEAIAIEHDQVNLAVAATEVSRYGSQTFIFQKSECELLGMIP